MIPQVFFLNIIYFVSICFFIVKLPHSFIKNKKKHKKTRNKTKHNISLVAIDENIKLTINRQIKLNSINVYNRVCIPIYYDK